MPELTKSELRRRLSAARRAVPPAVRKAEAAALATASLTAELPGTVPLTAELPGTVCAYWPVGDEPGSAALLDRLLRQGCRVLLPVVRVEGGLPSPSAAPLNWAEYTGAELLRAGPYGLREPAGSPLGCAAIADAALVLVPALAVDHRGGRLGRGRGYYDRTLPLARPGTPLVVIVRDDEVLPTLPVEPHDVLVNAALTPGRGLFPLPLAPSSTAGSG